MRFRKQGLACRISRKEDRAEVVTAHRLIVSLKVAVLTVRGRDTSYPRVKSLEKPVA